MLRSIWSTKPFALDLGLLLIRLAVSGFMLTHGYPKLVHFAERAERFSDPLGIGSTASLSLVVFAEFFCSILLFLGLFTRFALVPLMVTMAVVVFVVHGDDPFGDKEKALLFLIPYLGLFLTGPGHWSLDRMLKK
jgi:putative oxidoreductase